MDAIQDSLNQMMNTFHKRLDTIEEQLPKPSSSPGDLAAELAAFKAFSVISFRNLQDQIALLAGQVDTLETRSRRKILLLHGVPEVQKEDTAAVVTRCLTDQLKMDGFKTEDISRCHRMGRSVGLDRPRPILFKLRDVGKRDKVWSSKTKLKGSGTTLSEFLTKTRHDIFLAARQRFGVTNCWTRDGCVFVLGPSGSRHRVQNMAELDDIAPKAAAKPTALSKDASTAKEPAAQPKSRRAATSRR